MKFKLTRETAFSRRRFLKRSGAVAGGYVWGSGISSVLGGGGARPGNELRFPPTLVNGDDMVIAPTNLEIWPGFSTSVLAVNGSVPGPTIKVRRGEEFRSRVINQIDGEPVVIHWHGILAPDKMDGHPRDQVASGESYGVRIPVIQRGATCWYHSHTDMLTAEQVYQGLAGLFIIDDPDHDSLELPSGDHDIPLVLTDWRSNAQHQLTYVTSMPDRVRGYLGDTAMVNGTPEAYHCVDQGLYRFRMLNASNARILKIAFSDNRPFHLIGTDGGLLPEPKQVTSAILTPGQRLEILVDFADVSVGSSVIMRSLGIPRDIGPPSPAQDMQLDLLTFYVEEPATDPFPVPSQLVPFETWRTEDVLRIRKFTLSMSQGVHFMNGFLFDMDTIRFQVPQGDLEIWEYENTTSAYHPMHMHAAHFQVLERVNRSLAPEDGGWKDTVLVSPGETVRILIRFDANPGRFLHHCHNLEHEDAGMMQNFEVLPAPEADLHIQCNGDSCVISWSEDVTGQLESSTDLSAASWQPVAEAPTLIDGRRTVTVPVSGAEHFFRLVN